MSEEVFKVFAIMHEFLDVQYSGFNESSRQQRLHKLKMSCHAQLRSRKELILVEDTDEAMVYVREGSDRRMDDMEDFEDVVKCLGDLHALDRDMTVNVVDILVSTLAALTKSNLHAMSRNLRANTPHSSIDDILTTRRLFHRLLEAAAR